MSKYLNLRMLSVRSLSLLLMISVWGSWAGLASAKSELVVYTVIEADDLKKYADAFNRDHPDIELQFVRDSTGIITAKLLAEKDNPQADFIWQLAASSMLLPDIEEQLLPYAPKGSDRIPAQFKDKGDPPKWVGMDAWMAVICFNTIEAEKDGLPKPTSWQDLLDPVYRGHLVMPNPASSGTGYMMVSAWLQAMGETDGWNFLDGLHRNMAVYTHSGSKPCRLAAAGEHTIGISYAYRGAKLKRQGAPIDLIFAEEGVGWDVDAFAIVKTTKNLEAAKTLADWAASRQANEIYHESYAIVALPGVAKPIEHFPADPVSHLMDTDFSWMAENRRRVLKEWQQRYDAISEPKE